MGPNFLDPRTSKDGKPYGPKRYKQLVQDCWFISDNLHTSYTDVLDLAYIDRIYLIENIKAKKDATQKAIDDAKAKKKAARRK